VNKLIKTTVLVLISLLFCFLTYKLCYFIAEKYFFDKFFYQKSIAHGYWIPSKYPTHDDFGSRATDINKLQNNQPDALKTTNEHIFKIALYGDSYVWGQGIKNEQRFAKILQDKLNKIRPTRIISLAETGDNIFDHYQKYKTTPEIFGRIDLNIFGLLFNDLLFSNLIDNRYETKKYLESVSYFGCTGPEFLDDFQQGDKINHSLSSYSKNYCVYKKIVPSLPKEKTIYFDLGGAVYTKNYPDEMKFVDLISQDLPVFNPYSQEILSSAHPNEYNVSNTDAHPSALANQLYANLLYLEITTNPKWGFIKNE
jgi:hypothetical protein